MVQPTQQNIEDLTGAALAELSALDTLEALEHWRIAYLGRRGSLTAVLRGLSGLDIEERRRIGALANQAKQSLESGLETRTREINEAALLRAASEDRLDVTLPGRPPAEGRLHPTTQIVREICAAFIGMGFSVVEGPEVEWDHYNFEMLNIPKGHPARDMWNTLWVDYTNDAGEQPMLLRTHTSPMQARVMESQQPPVRVIVPGKCYRYEATDATHEWHFYQVEGLAVDEASPSPTSKAPSTSSPADSSAKSAASASAADYFPFVEPGVDMSIDCFACDAALPPSEGRAGVGVKGQRPPKAAAASAGTAAGLR